MEANVVRGIPRVRIGRVGSLSTGLAEMLYKAVRLHLILPFLWKPGTGAWMSPQPLSQEECTVILVTVQKSVVSVFCAEGSPDSLYKQLTTSLSLGPPSSDYLSSSRCLQDEGWQLENLPSLIET